MKEAFLITIKWDPATSNLAISWPHDNAIFALGLIKAAEGKILRDMLGDAQHNQGMIVPVKGVLGPRRDS